jgi:hypothetical protein
MARVFMLAGFILAAAIALVAVNPHWFRYGIAALILLWGIGAFLLQPKR